jgi:hypothetical protein
MNYSWTFRTARIGMNVIGSKMVTVRICNNLMRSDFVTGRWNVVESPTHYGRSRGIS